MKKYILSSILIICCLSTFGCSKENKNSNNENFGATSTQDDNKTSDASNKITISKEDQDYYSKAMQEKDESYCDKIEDSNYKKWCFSMLIPEKAKKTGNISLCDKLDWMAKDSCKNPILYSQALKNQDITLCDKMSWFDKNQCKSQILLIKSEASWDKTICKNINSMQKQECESKATIKSAIKNKNISACKWLDSFSKTTCENESLVWIAVSLKDPSYCDKNKTNSALWLNNCKNEAVSKIIFVDSQEKYCDYLDNSGLINSCKIKVWVIKSLKSWDNKYCNYLDSANASQCKNLYQEISQKLNVSWL